MNRERLADFLGWFSIGIGAAELVAPRELCDTLDVDGREGLVRAFGANWRRGSESSRSGTGRRGCGRESRETRSISVRCSPRCATIDGVPWSQRRSAALRAVTVLDVVCGMRMCE